VGLVRITRHLSFDDLRQGKVEPIDAYQLQVRDWILKPAKHLADLRSEDTDHGMALLALELMFFEPHGQYLTGRDSERRSRATFCEAFATFIDFSINQGLASPDIRELELSGFYRWARCGLFHSTRLANELLVDAVNFSNFCLSKNNMLGGWLVNPWLMLGALEKYVESYVELVRSEPYGELAKNFNNTFDRLLREPMDYFCT
jgi:hypothetical protein